LINANYKIICPPIFSGLAKNGLQIIEQMIIFCGIIETVTDAIVAVVVHRNKLSGFMLLFFNNGFE
jgi:hypothetical protein